MAAIEVFMGSNRQYADEFRSEAVKQVIERGFTVIDVDRRGGERPEPGFLARGAEHGLGH